MATLKTLADHIIDISENAVRSKSKKCELYIKETETDFFFKVVDFGIGMDEIQIKKVLDPFYTTKKERKKKFGMGIPFLKFSSELTGGSFKIQSKKDFGTVVETLFKKDNIDCQPIGNIPESIFVIIYMNNNTDWYIKRTYKKEGYEIDTSSLKKTYGKIFAENSFMKSIKDLLTNMEKELFEEEK